MTDTAPPPPTDAERAAPRADRDRPTRSAGVRQAWILGGSVLAVLILVYGGLQIVALMARERIVEEHTFTAEELAAVRVVEVDSGQGSVTIAGTDADQVEITAEITRGLVAPKHEVRIEGDRLVVSASCVPVLNHHCDVDHHLSIPRDMEVDLDVTEGSTTVADLAAPVTLSSARGSVDLVRIDGPIRARVTQGSLRGSQLSSETVSASLTQGSADIVFATTPVRVTIDSTFADVHVSVPDEPGTYAVSTATQFGQTANSLRTDPRSTSSIEVTSEFGQVTLGYTP